jgi:hypothetical protein
MNAQQAKISLNAIHAKISGGTCKREDASTLTDCVAVIDRLMAARDEARRIACYERAINLGWTPHRIADSNLWDCFCDE